MEKLILFLFFYIMIKLIICGELKFVKDYQDKEIEKLITFLLWL